MGNHCMVNCDADVMRNDASPSNGSLRTEREAAEPPASTPVALGPLPAAANSER